jgi:hypothetical protein
MPAVAASTIAAMAWCNGFRPLTQNRRDLLCRDCCHYSRNPQLAAETHGLQTRRDEASVLYESSIPDTIPYELGLLDLYEYR